MCSPHQAGAVCAVAAQPGGALVSPGRHLLWRTDCNLGTGLRLPSLLVHQLVSYGVVQAVSRIVRQELSRNVYG